MLNTICPIAFGHDTVGGEIQMSAMAINGAQSQIALITQTKQFGAGHKRQKQTQ